MSEIEDTLAANLKALRLHRGWSARRLSQETHGGVSARYIGHLEKAEHTASIRVLEELAKGLRVPPWLLLLPDLPAELGDGKAAEELVAYYSQASPKGRGWILHVAEREAEYSAPRDPNWRHRIAGDNRPDSPQREETEDSEDEEHG